MNKYQKSLNFIKNAFVPDLDILSKIELTKPFYRKVKVALNNLKELVDRATPKKATTKDEFRPQFDPNTMAVVDGEFVTHYHCPVCGEWLSCDAALEPDELDMYCIGCGQRIKGVETDE